MKFPVICTAFRPFCRNTLIGFATLKLPDLRLVIRDVAVHEHGNGKRWVGLPAKPVIDRDGVARRNTEGKIEYAAVLEFEGREVRDAFSAEVIAALLEFDPQAFDREAV